MERRKTRGKVGNAWKTGKRTEKWKIKLQWIDGVAAVLRLICFPKDAPTAVT